MLLPAAGEIRRSGQTACAGKRDELGEQRGRRSFRLLPGALARTRGTVPVKTAMRGGLTHPGRSW